MSVFSQSGQAPWRITWSMGELRDLSPPRLVSFWMSPSYGVVDPEQLSIIITEIYMFMKTKGTKYKGRRWI